FVSGSASPIAMLAPPQARHLQPGAVATQEGPSTRTAMLPVPVKSSGNYGWTTFFSAGSVLERRSRCRPVPSAGSDAVALLILEQLRAKAASTTLVTLPILHCAQGWSARCSRGAQLPKGGEIATK